MLRRTVLAAGFALGVALSAQAAEGPKVVATFSILGDLVKNVGGDRIELTTLVGANGDAHVYAPSPADAKALSEAKVVFTNGLKFEGWIDRLVKASGTKAKVVEAAKAVTPRPSDEEEHGHDHHGHDHGHDHEHEHEHEGLDPHAWQSVANARLYVTAIRDGLIAADAEGRATYEANASAYLARLDALDAEIKAAIAKIPEADRRIITSHDAFGYFAEAYHVEFIAPQGISTEAEASARDVAALVRQIRAEKAKAVFVENISDARLIEQISRETGVSVGGTLYSDALSDADGPAGTYIDMIRHNIKALSTALSS
ncbi:metal ABC transporter substrate-binding protein [Agaricicola taiwanensis]|uniref:Metal ABC transporter substrate-binding protein n=1 Tax=Agaricicola taiwanensis TaxID=591372 RepID=A0A8J2YMV2_9RHOB|nr:metal ABC transporter substrate-binding protein [Agaricicola taiwanensis]GGE53285.1 metal ABC transporter substrate-binding protein [Agaricicola taiwanensis]